MKQRITIILVGLLMTSCALFAPDKFGYKWRNGATEAKRDVAVGVLTWKVIGLPTPYDPEFSRRLDSDLGVKTDRLALCVVDRHLVRFVESYNGYVEKTLEQRFGSNAVGRIADEVRNEWREKDKKTANQALQTTSGTRRGFGKVPDSDRQRRGV